MKKILIAMSAAIGLSCGAHAAEMGPTAHVQGTLNIAEGCTVTMTLDQNDVTLSESDVAPGRQWNNLKLVPTCDGKTWIAGDKRGEQGWPIMTGNDGSEAALWLAIPGNWDAGYEHYVLAETTKGTTITIPMKLTDASRGLPKAGVSYAYQVNGGMWQD